MKDALKHAVKHIVKQSKTPAAESAPETASFERTPKAMLLGAVLVLLGGVLWGINATVSKLLTADYHAARCSWPVPVCVRRNYWQVRCATDAPTRCCCSPR